MKKIQILLILMIFPVILSCKTISPVEGGVKMDDEGMAYTDNCMMTCLDEGLGVFNILDIAVDLITFRWLWDHKGMPFNGLTNMVLKTVAILPFYVHHDKNSILFGSAMRGETSAEDYDAAINMMQNGGGSSYKSGGKGTGRCWCVKWPDVGWACYPEKAHAWNEYKRCQDGYGNCEWAGDGGREGDACFDN